MNDDHTAAVGRPKGSRSHSARTMRDVVNAVGGAVRGIKQSVQRVRIDPDGGITLILQEREEGPVGPPTQTELEQEGQQMDLLAQQSAEILAEKG